MSKTAEILVYITSDEKRVHGGDPLTLVVKDEQEKKDLLLDISMALKANVVQLRNGDYMIISHTS